MSVKPETIIEFVKICDSFLVRDRRYNHMTGSDVEVFLTGDQAAILKAIELGDKASETFREMLITGKALAKSLVSHPDEAKQVLRIVNCFTSRESGRVEKFIELWPETKVSLQFLATRLDSDLPEEVKSPRDVKLTDSLPVDAGHSITLIGEVWHIDFAGEHGQFPKNTNKAIADLVRILAKPDSPFKVADLTADPEGKLRGDASTRNGAKVDDQALKQIKNRLDDIEDLAELSGWSDHLAEEKTKLVSELKSGKHQFACPENTAFRAIVVRIKRFRSKLKESMPMLARHLEQIDLEFPHIRYSPSPVISWKF